jgi:sigma-E factor negative regulatory protein RseA
LEYEMVDAAKRDERRQATSALVDGALGDDETSHLCRDWRDDAELRVTWHAYHLIGDVLRSDDLAHAGAHDEAFLQAVRRRLADEPVVMAPAATVAAVPAVPARRRGWLAPLAVAAGFVAVAGVLVVTQLAAPGGGSAPVMATAPTGAPSGVTRVSAGTVAPAAAPVAADEALIRDARLDRYLEAHRQYGPSMAMVPGGVVRSMATAAPQR